MYSDKRSMYKRSSPIILNSLGRVMRTMHTLSLGCKVLEGIKHKKAKNLKNILELLKLAKYENYRKGAWTIVENPFVSIVENFMKDNILVKNKREIPEMLIKNK